MPENITSKARTDVSMRDSSRMAQKWGGVTSFLLAGSFVVAPLIYFMGSLRDAIKREGTDGKRRLYLIDLIVGAAIILLVVITWGGLLVEEIYCLRGIRCD